MQRKKDIFTQSLDYEDLTMKTTNDALNDQFKQFADFQAKSMEPLRAFADLATDASAKMLRKHYQVAGDWVDYAVEQSQLPLSGGTPSDIAAAQLAATKALTETMSNRAAEYVELTTGLGEKMRASAEKVTASVKAA